MENFILVVHVLLALGIIGLIMLQQGKGAEMGASFGSGSSQTVFGAAGTGNFFSRMTGILAAIFFVTSVALAVVAKKSSVIDEDFLPAGNSSAVQISDDPDMDAALESGVNTIEDDAAAALESADTEVNEAQRAANSTAADAEKSLENAAKALETEE